MSATWDEEIEPEEDSKNEEATLCFTAIEENDDAVEENNPTLTFF